MAALTGKTARVTGSIRGIGRGIAEQGAAQITGAALNIDGGWLAR